MRRVASAVILYGVATAELQFDLALSATFADGVSSWETIAVLFAEIRGRDCDLFLLSERHNSRCCECDFRRDP